MGKTVLSVIAGMAVSLLALISVAFLFPEKSDESEDDYEPTSEDVFKQRCEDSMGY